MTQVQSLTQTNAAVLQMHAQDQEKIKELEAKVDKSQQTADDAEQKSLAAAQTQSQPVPRVPIDEATVNHNFQILGDAEFQYVQRRSTKRFLPAGRFRPHFPVSRRRQHFV